MEITYELSLYLAFFAALGIMALFNWRKFFLFFFIYIFFEDFIRMKFFLNNVAIQVAKDLLLIGIYIGFFIDRRNKIKLFSFIPAIIGFIIFQFINIFNPHAKSALMGFAALKLNFFYLPILWLSYVYFQNLNNLKKFLLISFYIASCICIIAMIQIVTGPQIWYDFFGHHDTLIAFSYHSWAVEEGIFRPFGIFNN